MVVASRHASIATTGVLLLFSLSPPASAEQRPPVDVVCSIVSLIANPSDYEGKRVRTSGVARIVFEGTGIYLSSESAEHSSELNGVGLALKQKSDIATLQHLDRKWVIVEGIFHGVEPLETGFRGSISDISLLYAPGDMKVAD